MKHIPIIFPITLVAIIVLTFFTGAWAVSEAALNDNPPASAVPAPGANADAAPDASEPEAEHEWYEKAAIWVCPLH